MATRTLQCCGRVRWLPQPDASPQEEKEKRRLEQLERKKETQRLLEEEDSKLKGGKAPRAAPSKVTRAQIEDTLRRDHQHRETPDTGVLPPGMCPRVCRSPLW